MDDNLDKKKKKKNKKSKEKQVKHIDTQDVQIESKKRKLDEEVEPEDYPYQTDPSDHCETPLEAYADIKSTLVSLAHSLNKSIEDLAIYDPYYCEGNVKIRLKELGFGNVYNEKEDFYSKESHPEYDVLVTNPPYSYDNIEKLLQFSYSSGKPFLILVPNYVYAKDYYIRMTKEYARSSSSNNMFFIVPRNRYLYTTPKSRRQRKSGKFTSPFPSFWYCCMRQYNASCIKSVSQQPSTIVCTSTRSLPANMLSDYDDRKKKLKNALKRKKNKDRKKMKQI
jgi:hypothetical protein